MFTTEHILITLLSFNIIYILLLLFIYFKKVALSQFKLEDLWKRRECDFKY